MTVLTQHAAGTFSWPELHTTDPIAAKKFYGDLFGWSAVDNPMPAGVYTIFQKDGRDSAAVCPMMPEQAKAGVPPHFNAYITVANVDDAATRAKQLGGTVLMEPFDIMDKGRSAVIQDPTGATFSLWEPRTHIGVAVLDEPGAMCWTELTTGDTAKAAAFYTALLGWKTQEMPGPNGPYTLFQRLNGTNAGGMMKATGKLQGVPPNWLTYFQVKDIKATAARVPQLGGKVFVEPTPIPGTGTFAVLSDPQGGMFGVLQGPN